MSPSVAFTYTNFPNLWDEILTASDLSTQLKVRGVAQALNAAVNRRTQHLVLTRPPLTKLEDPLDCPFELHATPYHLPQARPAPLSAPDASSKKDSQEHARRLITRACRCVDVRGLTHPGFNLGDLQEHFPRLDTVRLTRDLTGSFTPYIPFSCKTIVLFPHPKGLEVNKEHRYYMPGWAGEDSDDDDGGFSPMTAPGHSPGSTWPREPPRLPLLLRDLRPDSMSAYEDKLPWDVRQVVVNLDGGAPTPTASFHFLRDLPRQVKEVVIVVPRFHLSMDPGTVDRLEPLGLARAVVDCMRSPYAKFTVVGLERVSPTFTRQIRKLVMDLLIQEVQLDVDYGINDPLTLSMDKDVRKKFKRLASHMRDESWDRAIALARAEREEEYGSDIENGICPFYDCDGGCDPYEVNMAEVDGPEAIGLEKKVKRLLKRVETITVEGYRKRVGSVKAAWHMVQ